MFILMWPHKEENVRYAKIAQDYVLSIFVLSLSTLSISISLVVVITDQHLIHFLWCKLYAKGCYWSLQFFQLFALNRSREITVSLTPYSFDMMIGISYHYYFYLFILLIAISTSFILKKLNHEIRNTSFQNLQETRQIRRRKVIAYSSRAPCMLRHDNILICLKYRYKY